MEQQFNLPDNYATCLLVQTINGKQETRLVAIERAICDKYQQPFFEADQQGQSLITNQQQQQSEVIQPDNQNQNLNPVQQQQQYQQQSQQQYQYQQQQYQQQYQTQYIQQQNQVQYIPVVQEKKKQHNESLKLRENFKEKEEKDALVSSYNKLCCFTTFYFLVHVGCILIQIFLHGSGMAMVFWIISGVFLIISMLFGCCGVRNSSRCIQIIHIFLLTAFFVLEIVAFAKAIQHPVLYDYVKSGYSVYNTRLLDTSSPSYTDCEYLKSNYPEYYKDFQSQCEFEVLINEDSNYGATVNTQTTTISGTVEVTEYTTSLQYGMIGIYSFGLLLALILYVYLCKNFKNLYSFVNEAELQKKVREHQQQGEQQQPLQQP